MKQPAAAGDGVLGEIRDLLLSQSSMTLATVDEYGGPSATPLFFFPDSDLTLYWLSSAESRHSRNLLARPRAAIAIYPAVDHWEKIRGVQMEGSAEAVSDSGERRRIVKEYCNRFHLGTMLALAISQSVLYAFRPKWIRYMDNSRGLGYKVEVEL